MYLNLCPQTIGLSDLSMNKLIPLAAKYGFAGIDFQPQQATSLEAAREWKAILELHGLRWGLFFLPADFLRISDSMLDEALHKLDDMLPLIREAGCVRTYNHIWPGSNELEFHSNYEWHRKRITMVAERLDAHGITLGVEFIGPLTLQRQFRYPFIRKLSDAVALVDSLSVPVGLVLDAFHWFTSQESEQNLRNHLTGRKIVNVHLNDAVAGRKPEEQLDTERAMPNSGGAIDPGRIVQILKELQYDGPVICEPFQPSMGRFRLMEDELVLKEVAECMLPILSGTERG